MAYPRSRWALRRPVLEARRHTCTGTFAEAFCIVEGVVTVHDGRAWTAARPGDFLYVPPNGVHAFRNDSGAPASMLILFAPGAPREAYFSELAERIASGRSFSDDRAAFMARHDQFEV